ncbi:MOSC domain-containing protein [Aestuariicoccus sp. MJ-SS9]|uniref:MOSC domain-containing protein n=1 Tax=Aestuariicoccus sp. MJ-SS9 TaxID=3079855 RepID=UPI002906B016|nr:MOSC domain-containing protein [Aestuariicoccus sp. MJ-SS9]MDU8910414.1 sulfurase [Aestuariicoccus sp. MJ-SS9]
MPALKPTSFEARIVWLGRVPQGDGDMRSRPADKLQLEFGGAAGERHTGQTRRSCKRVLDQHPFGTEIANVRQLALVCEEEMAQVAAELGLPALDPVLTGASVVLSGLPDFSHLPPSSRLQGADGATLVVDMENRPCNLPAREIEKAHPGHGKAFKAAAKGRRGVTAWVERPGRLAIGDVLRLHVPDQPVWAGYDRAPRALTAAS